jgi:hypothetical protein
VATHEYRKASTPCGPLRSGVISASRSSKSAFEPKIEQHASHHAHHLDRLQLGNLGCSLA